MRAFLCCLVSVFLLGCGSDDGRYVKVSGGTILDTRTGEHFRTRVNRHCLHWVVDTVPLLPGDTAGPVSPSLDSARADPSFREAMRSMGLHYSEDGTPLFRTKDRCAEETVDTVWVRVKPPIR